MKPLSFDEVKKAVNQKEILEKESQYLINVINKQLTEKFSQDFALGIEIPPRHPDAVRHTINLYEQNGWKVSPNKDRYTFSKQITYKVEA